MEDAAYEMIEQAISFRDILEKRLGKLKEDVDKNLVHETTMYAQKGLIESLEKQKKKAKRKLNKHQEILDKALKLHYDICGRKAAGSDSESDD